MPPSSPSTGTPASPTARVSYRIYQKVVCVCWGGGQLPPPNEYMQTVLVPITNISGLQEIHMGPGGRGGRDYFWQPHQVFNTTLLIFHGRGESTPFGAGEVNHMQRN